jgi:hypothetical protein
VDIGKDGEILGMEDKVWMGKVGSGEAEI